MHMTLSPLDLGLYSVALLILFLTPGPVWLALVARAVSGGFQSAWPLALGVAIGDVVWPLLAILGLAWITSEYEIALTILRWVACVFFLWLGYNVIRNAAKEIDTDRSLTRPGMLAGFLAGVAAILGNPKAILFYMGVLPGFFDLSQVTSADIAAICVLSVLIPFLGNIALALLIDRVRGVVSSASVMRRMTLWAGWLLIAVGLVLPFT
jgi:threonine/homoserine/homoserine lactone efflux protein